MVCWKYGIGGDTSKEKATKVLDMKPFFPKQGTDELGYQVLVEVISTLIYGHGKPGLKEVAPVNGYSVEMILEVAAIVKSVLKEWSTRMSSYPQNLAMKAQIGCYTNNKHEYMTKILTSMEEE